MPHNRTMTFTRYVWCDTCHHFEPFNTSNEHQAALQGKCPKCGGNDICSRPPEHHEKMLKRLGTMVTA